MNIGSINDKFARAALGFKKEGVFVDIGATQPCCGSDSWVLERHFGWRGVLVQPCLIFHKALKNHRSAVLDTRALSDKDNDLTSLVYPPAAPMLRRLSDPVKAAPSGWKKQMVRTVTLNSLLELHTKNLGCDGQVDYVSITDSKIHESTIKDLEKWRPLVITLTQVKRKNGPHRVEIPGYALQKRGNKDGITWLLREDFVES